MMHRSLLLVCALGASGSVVFAQQPVRPAASLASALQAEPAEQTRLLVIENNGVYLDGQLLPNAVPPGLNLMGVSFAMELSGPIIPVVEVDGQAYVLENDRLVRFEESSRAGQGVYILGELDTEDAASMPDDQLAMVSEQAYLREVATRDEGLYERLQEERTLEEQVAELGDRVRHTQRGPAYDVLRADLRKRLSDLFRMKQLVRREEIEQAQSQLDDMRRVLDLRDSQHDVIVDARLREICGE